MNPTSDIAEFLITRRAKVTPEDAGLPRSTEALSLLASWAATPDPAEAT